MTWPKSPEQARIYTLALTLAVVVADYLTGPFIQLAMLYVFPVSLSAWSGRLRGGLAFAVSLPLARILFYFFWQVPWTIREVAANAVIQIIVLSVFAYLVVQSVKKKELEEEVRILRGILPICSFCKRIRDANDTWQALEKYIGDRSDARFSHGVCPDCMKKHYGDLSTDS